MNNDSQKDELKVEHYDAEKAKAKKKKILKRIAIGAGVAALIALLGYFGLVKDKDGLGKWPHNEPMTEFMVGGNGAWFNSVIVFFGE